MRRKFRTIWSEIRIDRLYYTTLLLGLTQPNVYFETQRSEQLDQNFET